MPKGHEKEGSKTVPNNVGDNIKDTRDISNTLSVLDAVSIRTNPFGANVSGENSYRRAERISAAVHLITNHVPEVEPVRSSLRTSGIRLLRLILELRIGFRTIGSEKGQSALSEIREMISLVRLLAVSGYVSASNANVVVEAIDELGSLIVISQRSTLAEQLTISRADLVPSVNLSSGDDSVTRTPRPRERKTIRNPRANRVSEGPESRENASARSEQILGILRSGGMVGIKDIAANLPQYSEKMIQRELASLVLENKVRKLGAKRWSRYQIVS